MDCEILQIAWKQSRIFQDQEGTDTMLCLDENGFISVNKVSQCFVVLFRVKLTSVNLGDAGVVVY
jgi:hypothetical protein